MGLRPTTHLRPGDTLDHYRLGDFVGTGGTASVFRAIDTRTGHEVAIKIPHGRQSGNAPLASGFGPNVSVSHELLHRSIVRVLPNGGASRPYVVMEWVDGQLLRQILDSQGRLSIERALRIALQVCEVLQYVHEHGIAHLDLKPDNIILGANDCIKLIDIDVVHEPKRGLFSWFRPKSMGTPDYAAPEQIKGNSPDARSDIYSLGLILYEMLTGEVPFSSAAPEAALHLRLSADPIPPSEINPAIPASLQDVVCRAISRVPAKRQASARELYSELEVAAQSCERELIESV